MPRFPYRVGIPCSQELDALLGPLYLLPNPKSELSHAYRLMQRNLVTSHNRNGMSSHGWSDLPLKLLFFRRGV